MKTFTSLRAARRRLKDSGGWLFDVGDNGPYAVTDCKGTAVDLRGKKRIALAEAAELWDETKAMTFKKLEAVMDYLGGDSVVRGSVPGYRLTGRYSIVAWEQRGPRVVSSFNSLAKLSEEVELNYIDPLGWYEARR